MAEEVEQKFVDIHPLGKWKRFLLFLGDYFVAFILSFVLFNLVIFPISRAVVNAPQQIDEVNHLENKALKLLKDDGFIFMPSEGSTLSDSVNYTFKVFLSYYAFDEANPDVNHPQYGHKLENEVIRTYYVNVIKDTPKYINDFKEVNGDGMFEIGDGVESIKLKYDYKVQLANELVEVTDESKYSVAMTNFRDHVFAKLFYVKVYNHILENDYVKDGVSYNSYRKQISDINSSLDWIGTVSSFITVVLTWSLVFVLYPLVNKENRTITMSAMRLNKLHYKSLALIDGKTVMIQSFYHLVILLSSTVFLPVLYYGFAYCFNLPLLFVISLCSLALIIASGVFIIFNQYNRSGADILTNTVIVKSSELDNMYLDNIQNGK